MAILAAAKRLVADDTYIHIHMYKQKYAFCEY